MLYNIIPTIFPLWNSYGLPFSIMHLKTQVKIGIVRIWKMARLIITIKNPYFCFTGTTTFVFDRGKLDAKKVHLSWLPVALNCNFAHKTVNQLLEFNFGHYNNLEILVLLSSVRSSTSSSNTSNNKRNSDSRKKKFLIATTIIRNKSNELTRKLLPQAQFFQTLHKNAIGKLQNTQLIANLFNPILRAERIINSNGPLITGQSVNRQNFIQQSRTQQVVTALAKTYYEESVQSFDAQKTRFKNEWSKFLPPSNNNNHEPPSMTEGSSQSGGFYSNSIYET